MLRYKGMLTRQENIDALSTILRANKMTSKRSLPYTLPFKVIPRGSILSDTCSKCVSVIRTVTIYVSGSAPLSLIRKSPGVAFELLSSEIAVEAHGDAGC